MEDFYQFDITPDTFGASRILPLLWQGSAPPTGTWMREAGYDVVVLCAMEYQPPASAFPGVSIIHAPNDDSWEPTKLQLVTAAWASKVVSTHVQQGKKVLVTCMQGKNRSGLVTAFALHRLLGWSGQKCIDHIQRHRRGSMRNHTFNELLCVLPDKAKHDLIWAG